MVSCMAAESMGATCSLNNLQSLHTIIKAVLHYDSQQHFGMRSCSTFKPPGVLAVSRWRRAIRTVMLRNRTSVYSRQSLAQRRRTRGSPQHPPVQVPESLLQRQVVGPQIRLTFQVQVATKLPGHPLYKLPPPAKLHIDVCKTLPQSQKSQDRLHRNTLKLGDGGLASRRKVVAHPVHYQVAINVRSWKISMHTLVLSCQLYAVPGATAFFACKHQMAACSSAWE